jgi:(p)ppGpp synthase/HD superfamily hydrolase
MRPAVVLSPRYADAVAYAAAVHAEQARKGTGVPYVAHLLAVSALVLEAGGDEDLAIAALLHDAAEDHGGEARLADIAGRFGDRVAGIVRSCSDSLEPEGMAKASWEARKREHLGRMREADLDTLTVWTADKVHNGRAIVTDLEQDGLTAMDRFSAAPDRVLWYYRENLARAEKAEVAPALVVPLRDVVARMAQLLDADVPAATGR